MDAEKIISTAGQVMRANFRVPALEWEEFKAVCAARDVLPAAVLREIIKAYVFEAESVAPADRGADLKNTNIRIDVSDWERFKTACASRGVVPSDVLRAMIRDFTASVERGGE